MTKKRKILYSLTFFTTLLYLGWRTFFTLPLGDAWYAVAFGILLLVSEIISGYTAAVLIWSEHKAKKIDKPEIKPEEFLEVDVFIATHNEDVALLYKTVNACVNMQYPDASKIHIYLADDTNRPEVAQLANNFGVGYLGMTDNQEAKSGNLNHALSKTTSPFIATFDADMIPFSNFLMETVPYFVDQQSAKKPLGFVQSPQSFYNPDLFQFNLFSERDLPNEQDFFSREVNVLNNAHEAAVYTGSNTVLLRQAIVEAGGFPTDTMTEDFELGALINSKGYRSLSTLEPLASGLTPMDIQSMFKQRIRWARGVVRSVHNLKVWRNKNFNFSQKVVFLNSYFYWWSFLRRIIFILAPIMFTVFDTRVVATNIWQLAIFWLPGYVLLKLSMRNVSSDIRTQSWGEVQETVFAPYLILPVLMEIFVFKDRKFKVTPKTNHPSSKDNWMMLPHLSLLILCIIGFIRFNFNKYGSEIAYGSVVSFWLLVHMFNLFFAVLFFLRRPIYRQDERFAIDLPMKVRKVSEDKENGLLKPEDAWHPVKVVDISEHGLSFKVDFPLYFPPSKQLEFHLEREDNQVDLKGRIVRVKQQQQTWLYGIALDEISEESYRSYLHIIYDGYNHSLPKFRDPWITPLDRLVNIVRHRLTLQPPTQMPKTQNLPVLQLNEPIQRDGYEVVLKRFDYETISFFILEDKIFPADFDFVLANVCFNLSLEDCLGHEYRFKINNLEELLTNADFHLLIESWLKREESLNASELVTP